MKIAIVILNWNGEIFLEALLPTVIRYSDIDGAEVIIADNGSEDNSVKYLRQNFPQIKIIELDKNYGFTGGYNMALQQIDAEYYVLLNSDVEVTENWLKPIISFLDENKDVAACMPKILSHSSPAFFEYAGAAGGFIDRFGYPFCKGRILGTIEEDKKQYDKKTDIFWATGACMFVRSKIFHEAGKFDDDFFAHMEEIDLCWRMKNMGYRIVSIPEVAVFHVGGGTLPNNTPQKLFLNYRNNLMLLFKNLPSYLIIPIILARLILDGLSAIIYLVEFKFHFFMVVPRAHFAFYAKLPKLFKKRLRHEKKIRKNSHKEIYKGSIVFDYYLRKIKKFTQIKFR